MAIDFPNSPAVNQTYAVGDRTWKWTGATWDALGQPAVPTTNAIINGAFDIWQRGTSFAGTGVGVYTADRWYYNADGSGSTRSISQQTFTPGTAPVSGYEGQFYIRYNQSVAGTSGTYNQIAQRIEDVRTFAGQTITVSFWAKSDATRTITPYVVQNFGSGGSTGIANIQSVITTSTSWTRYSFTHAVASVAGKTIGTGSSIELRFAFASNLAQTIDIWGVQLEAGSVATPFKRNAPSIQAELAACLRYFYKLGGDANYNSYGLGSQQSGSVVNLTVPFQVQMRTAPTLSGSAANTFNINGTTPTSYSVDVSSKNNCMFNFDGSFSLGTFAAVKIYDAGSNASYLTFSAEL